MSAAPSPTTTVARRLARLGRALRPLTARRTRGGARPTAPVATARLVLSIVDDPGGRIRLIAARGELRADTVQTLVGTLDPLPSGHLVHIDLADAALCDAIAVSVLEAAADRLEVRGVGVRIVGVDPEHPVLTGRSTR